MEYGPAITLLVLAIPVIVDIIRQPSARMTSLPKVAWVIIVVCFSIVGIILWVAVGRPRDAPVGAAQFSPAPGPGSPRSPSPHVARPRSAKQREADFDREVEIHNARARQLRRDADPTRGGRPGQPCWRERVT
ncbi:MAG: hypothetical protein JWQ43_2720 [Glaciihabitans sp.]|nr:hypothetical protein [Glaciihabitans sp.]